MPTDSENVRLSGWTGSVRRTVTTTRLTLLYGPAARCKRFSSSCRFAVLHQCIRPLIGAFAPGHHGYQRACVLISGQASSGPFGSPVFACAGKTDPPSLLIPLADLGWKLLIGLRHRLLLMSRSSFVRAKGRSFVPARRTSLASRAGAVKAGRHAWLAAGSRGSWLRPGGAEHGARIKRVGRLHRRSSSTRRRVLWPAPPRRCGQACWRARSPARCGATASWRLRSRI